MNAIDVLPRLKDTHSALLCSDNSRPKGESTELYRVPVHHRISGSSGKNSASILDALPSIPACDQLRVIALEGCIHLFCPKANAKDPSRFPLANSQTQGAIVILSPDEWSDAKREFEDWQFEGVEAAFDGLEYGIDDIVVFAKLNYSPDCWYLVTQGPMAGKVFWWTHDGDSQMDEPWAEDIADWGRSVWKEVPEVFGGLARFTSLHTIDDAPPNTELFPEKLIADIRAF